MPTSVLPSVKRTAAVSAAIATTRAGGARSGSQRTSPANARPATATTNSGTSAKIE
jgi:hypothetical protein